MSDKIILELENFDCLIIENYKNNIDEKVLYSILNQTKQLENYIVINSVDSIKINYDLKDLKSRVNSFVFIGIQLPTDDLLKVIISKSFSERQVSVSPKFRVYY